MASVSIETRKLYDGECDRADAADLEGRRQTPCKLGVPRDIYAIVPRGQDSSLTAAADVPDPLFAPLARANEVGKLRVTAGRQDDRHVLRCIRSRMSRSRLLQPPDRRRETLDALTMAEPLPHLLSQRRVPEAARRAHLAARPRLPVRRQRLRSAAGVRRPHVPLSRALRPAGAQPRGNPVCRSPHTHEQWLGILDDLIRRNGGGDMYVYVQVTRGMEYGRNHAFPARGHTRACSRWRRRCRC